VRFFLKYIFKGGKLNLTEASLTILQMGKKKELNMELKHLECCAKQKIGTREINPSG
jgi:hypothetical protein